KLVKDAVSNVRGGRPVTSASAEENYDARNKYGDEYALGNISWGEIDNIKY
ncbi:hypothetical protein PF005_g27876, partial [Phytophthora fragariae]